VLFPTLDYVLYLTLTVLIYWSVNEKWRLPVLATASVIFYAAWRVSYLPLLFGIVLVTWIGGRWMASLAPAKRKVFVRPAGLIAALLIPLVLFKYWNWVVTDLEAALRSIGLDLGAPKVHLALPIGISFFTFQALAYVIDSRRSGDAERSPLRFATFIMFFPQLVAGPIVRAHELLPQLRKLPLLSEGRIGSALFRIGRGMAKKVLIADILRLGIVDPLFDDPTRFTGIELWIGLYAYTMQIYCDFSGYTDIAIGSARLFGIDLPENFRRPYKATSVAGFWRRWHLTLSNWVRDYIYFPLGGARASTEWRIYFNIMVTLLIIGIWHGASWNFVVYGLLHGTGVAINRYIRKRTGRRPDDPLPTRWAWCWRFFLTFNFIVIARILFRAPDFGTAAQYALNLFDTTLAMPRFSMMSLAIMVIGYAIHFSPDHWQDRAQAEFTNLGPLLWAPAMFALGIICLVLGTGHQLAFVYYQF
jgi:D-alanyl-lipoteichoic acid acyltransferase DltB (MBOAT superfamily)